MIFGLTLVSLRLTLISTAPISLCTLKQTLNSKACSFPMSLRCNLQKVTAILKCPLTPLCILALISTQANSKVSCLSKGSSIYTSF